MQCPVMRSLARAMPSGAQGTRYQNFLLPSVVKPNVVIKEVDLHFMALRCVTLRESSFHQIERNKKENKNNFFLMTYGASDGNS